MISGKHRKALVFISAGVGDAVLLIPLVNQLKKDGYHVTGLFTSKFHCESIFENTHLFDSISIKKDKWSLVFFSFLNYKKYDSVFLNHFAFSRSHIYLAEKLGKDVYTNYNKFPVSGNSKAVHYVAPVSGTHDALQNVFLYNNSVKLLDLNFNLHYLSGKKPEFNLPQKYIVIQISSANNKAPHKNWPLENWIELFAHLENILPKTSLVILGDESEQLLHEKLKSHHSKTIISLIGKTRLSDVVDIIYNSWFYIGLDSGLMHLAVALNKPTFTLWGASNPTLYGYERLGKKHRVVSLHVICGPCSAWIDPNTSRVTDPLLCPDFKCIKGLSTKQVVLELENFLGTLNAV